MQRSCSAWINICTYAQSSLIRLRKLYNMLALPFSKVPGNGLSATTLLWFILHGRLTSDTFLCTVSEIWKGERYNFCSYPSHREDENSFVSCQKLSFKGESSVAVVVIPITLKTKMLKLNMCRLPEVTVFCAIIHTWFLLFWGRK